MAKKKVIIIGAGPAGLAAGYKLLKEARDKYEVCILEGTTEIGGISKTAVYKGNRMDVGGHRFFTKDKEVNDFWFEIMPKQGKPSYDDKILKTDKQFSKGGPNPEKEDNVMLIRNRVSRIYYLKKFFDYPIRLKLQTFQNMGMGRTIMSGFSYVKAMMIKKPEDNLENFYINHFGKTLYNMFFEKYTEKLWGRHPSEIDASWGAQRVKGVSILAVLKDAFSKLFHMKSKTVETSLIDEFYYPKYGPGHFYETVAKEIEAMGGTILKERQVVTVNGNKTKIKSVVCDTKKGQVTIEGDYILSSMPLKDLVLSLEGVPTNPEVFEIAKGLPYRDFITVGLLLKKMNLKNETSIKTINNIIPDNWVYVQDPAVRMCRFQIFNNWSPYMVKDINKHIWIGLEYVCHESDDLWAMSDKEFQTFAVQEFLNMNLIDKEDVIDTHIVRVKKAYPAYFDTYVEIDQVVEYISQFKNLFCIGRNGQHRYNNMDHSILTGFVAAKNIIEGSTDKTVLWQVNAEKQYHEETKAVEEK